MEKSVKREYLLLGLILFVATGLRLAWIFYCDTVPVFDFLKYHLGALSLASGQGYQLFGEYTAFEPVGFSFYLSLLYRVFGENLLAPKLMNVFMGADSVFLVYLLGKRYFRPGIGLLAATFVALSPRQIVYTSVLSTEIIFTYFLLLVIFVISVQTRKEIKPVVLGVLGAVLAFIKPFMLVFPMLAFVLLLMQRRHEDHQSKIHDQWYQEVRDKSKHEPIGVYDNPSQGEKNPGIWGAFVGSLGWTLIITLVMLVCILPWTARNYKVFREVIPISTNGGITLYLNNNDYAEGHWQDPFKIPGSPLVGMKDEETGFWDEIKVDKLAGAEGKRWIMENPDKFARLGLMKTYHVYKNAADVQFAVDYTSNGGPLANRGWIYQLSDFMYKLMLGGLAFYLLMALINLFWRRDGFLGQGTIWLIWLMFSATFFVFEGQPRYLFPLVPLFSLLISWSIFWFINGIQTIKRKGK